jgi:predicted outer membrane protein
MSSLHRSAAGTNWLARRRRWPWWALLAAIVGAVLLLPSLRARDNAATRAPEHHHDVVPAAVTGTGIVATELPDGWTMTSFGMIGPADREFLVKVRQAGLWEGPAGQLARDHAADKRVKEVGAQLATDHHGLDTQVRQVAAQLGVPLPNEASAEQQGWVRELDGKRGGEFDRTFANRLRAAHGKVFALVGTVRSGTRNELVRSFAQTAVNVVMKHMTLLESIGKVDFEDLPTPAAAPTGSNTTPGEASYRETLWVVVALVLAGGGTAAFRALRAFRARRTF